MAANERLSNLMFLLGLAPLAAGCPGDDSGGDTGLTTASTMTTMTPTTGASGDGTGDGGTGPGSASAEDGPEPTTSSMDGTTGGDGPGATDGGSDTGALDCSDPPVPTNPISALCMTYTTQQDECYGPLTMECLDYYAAYCQYSLDNAARYGEMCPMAIEELLTCVSALSCEDLETNAGCETQEAAFGTACGAASGIGPMLERRR